MSHSPAWRRILTAAMREPLLHFFVGGAAIFALWRATAPAPAPPPPPAAEIRLDPSTREAVLAAHAEQRGLDGVPDDERAAVLEHWVRQEVLVREARRLGLADGDAIVRRRLVQLMEFVLDNSVEVREPTNDDLRAWIDDNRALYTRAPRVDLTHVFVDAEKHADGAARLQSARAALEAGTPPASLGDPFPRDRVLRGWSRTRLTGEFGDAFATAFDAPVGTWAGPFDSVFGKHLVRIDERYPETLAELDAVRARARADWLSARREAIRAEAVSALVERYQVVEAE